MSMSLPRQVPSHSSSPSKSSLRRISGPQSRNPSLLPSPHFDDERLASATHESPQHEPDESYDEHAIESSMQPAPPPPPPNFQPFFTLIEDLITHEHYHPMVHYIFADDDADIITEAACWSLEENQSQYEESQLQSQAIAWGSGTSRYLRPPIPGVKEHYLVLDVHPITASTDMPDGAAAPGLEVSQAQSLSSEWQVLRTRITQAPTIRDSEDEGLMLRIEGRGDTPEDKGKEKEREKEGLEELIERFQRRLEDVRLVMEGGGGKEG